MIVIDKRESKKGGTVNAGIILIGFVFEGTVGSHTGVFLRTYDGIVSLTNPQKTWCFGGSPSSAPTVYDYRMLRVELQILSELVP